MDAQAELTALLNAELTRARAKNPSFSLRAFAKRLGVQPSALSEILGGRRLITQKIGGRILDRLPLDPVKAAKLKAQLKGRYGGEVRQYLRSPAFRVLDADQFCILADWYHFAIRSLAEITGFKRDPRWIAQRLGVRVREARSALSRLDRLGLLENPELPLTTTQDVKDSALQRAHRQHLTLAMDSLEQTDVEDRDITGITMAIDPAKLPEAKRRIRRFRRELCDYLESGNKAEVYRLNVELFPMTKRGKER